MLPRVSWAAACVLTLAAVSHAQLCPGPDGFTGPCWAPVQPNLPQFPPFATESSTICWTNCVVNGQNSGRIQVQTPIRSPAGQYTTMITWSDPGGIPMVAGLAVMDYTRTWFETDVAGVNHQVWRFALKADLSNVAPAGTPIGCPPGMIPDCVAPGAFQTAFYYGYADWALDCGTGVWSNSLVLFHNCDRYTHDPAFSSRPGVFHPLDSFAIVAPDGAVNTFVPAFLPAPGGPMVAEAVRNVPVGLPWPTAIAEEFLTSGFIQPIFNLCVCFPAFPPAPAQVTLRLFAGAGSCPDPTGQVSSFQCIDTTPYGGSWFNMHTTSIGRWTSPFVYPGQEFAWVDECVSGYHDSCSVVDGTSPTGNFLEWFYGGSTSDGWIAFPADPVTPITQNFTDLAGNFALPLPGPAIPPFIGNIFPTRHLIYVNVP